MASDGVNITEDAEMAESDGDKVVTMMDVLQEQQDFEEDANAVLGASDDKNCTYPKGYIKRQALYACLTCCTEAKVDPTKRAGVCLACSLTCHENHELIELYTKRNFRCDCGNPKFNSHPCQFTSEKSELNYDNIYNQNFSGLYCTCHRPYPDPDSTIDDEDMIQCIICEDWLHASHLEAVVPANDQYSEMVCKNCMEKNEFLHDYSMFAVTVEAADVDIITVNGDAKSANSSVCNGDSEKEKLVNGIEENKTEIGTTSVTVNGDVEMNGDKENSTDNKAVDESVAAEITQDELRTVESSEIKPEEEEKPKADDSKMDLHTESKTTNQEEQSVETTETNEPAKTDALAEQEQKETSEDISEKSDAAENTTIADPTQNFETSPEKNESTDEKSENADNTDEKPDNAENTDEKPENADNTDEKSENADNTDEKMESTDNKPERADETIKEETETQDQKSKQSRIEDGDGDNAQENKTDTSEGTEQQLLDDLTALTADNPTSEEKTDSAADENPETATEDKHVESMEQSEEFKVQKETAEELENESGDKSDEKPDVKNETATGNIEVPDTSQFEKDAKENTKEKTDSVMDAIDELLQTANEAKEKESAEEVKEPTSEPTESKKASDNVETKETDVEMSASENKLDNDGPEKKEDTVDSNNKPSTDTDVQMSDTSTDVQMSDTSTDVQMSDTSTQNETVGESKVDEPTTDLENKDVNDTEVKLDNESVAESPQVNTDDSELKTSDDNDSTINTEPSKDENEVHTVTENAKEHKRKLSTDLTNDVSSKKAKLECVRPKAVKRIHKGATFWPSNFRHKLCTCGECLSMYKDLKVLFLIDLEDTVFAYESLGKENVAGGASQYEKGMQALSSLDRIHQINALTEYNKMRDKLLDFLKSFKDRKEVVKEEDIKAFFAGMKPRREPDGVYFCR